MIEHIGWLGLVILIIAYILLAFNKTEKLFIPVNTFASFVLFVYAILIKDLPFAIVNGFVTIILAIKWYKRKLIF